MLLPHCGIFTKGLPSLEKFIRIYWKKTGMLLANANSVANSYFPRSYGLSESRQDCYLFPAIKKKIVFLLH